MEIEKLQIPGWRIEQKFNNKCLIGNWNEERRKFQHGCNPFGNSSHRCDFGYPDKFLPDTTTRRVTSMKNEGLPKSLIFSHHGNCYSNNMISWYDQYMNKRDQLESALPRLRTWDSKSISWVPERTDKPLQGVATNFGLHKSLQEKWEREKSDSNGLSSTYKSSYKRHPSCSMVYEHHSNAKSLSSHFNSHNIINKDLRLRNVTVNLGPESPPTLVSPNQPFF